VTDHELIREVDELRYQLKTSGHSAMRDDFTRLLDGFIRKWNLDTDQHSFAAPPGEST